MFSLFGSGSPFDADVDKATSENNTTEQWDLIIDICDKAGANEKNAKDCLRSILRRMAHNDPHVAIQAVTLLDSCIKNCGRIFHLEIASRDFQTEFQRLMSKSPTRVTQKMRVSLKKWSENEFKTDQQLNLIPTLYQKMKSEGVDFSDNSDDIPKSQAPLSKDPNVVSSQQEEDDIARAIELSLKEKEEPAKPYSTSFSSSSLYPTMSVNDKASPKQTVKKEGRKVRALYDFEAAEDNEMTFFSGEIVYVVDDSDSNWWTGYNDRGEGLFPSNFVTADLNADVESNHYDTKTTTLTDERKEETKPDIVQIDEMQIDRLLLLLHEANPEDPSQDPEEIYFLEQQVSQMLPLIDNELENVDRHHAKLTQLSTSLVEAINLYHMLMRDADLQTAHYGQIPAQNYRQSGPPLANGMFNPYYAMPPQQLGNQFVHPPNMLPHMGMPQYQRPEEIEPSYVSNMNAQPNVPVSMMPQPHMYQMPGGEQHGQHAAGVQSPHQMSNIPGVRNLPNNMQPQSPMGHMGPAIPPHYQQNVAPPSNYVPTDGINLNEQQQMNVHPMPNQPQQVMGYRPNTVMTTQVQQGVPHPGPMQHQSPNHQHVIAAINQPVSTTILPQNDLRSNIPVYQQQR